MGSYQGRSGVSRLAFPTLAISLAAVVAVLYFAISGEAENAASHVGSVQIIGSETMRPVVAACAEDFMMKNPQADIIVKGGGSGDGIAALLHGIVDIGMTSRELSSRERDYARSTGVELHAVPLALDGITVIVNRANPVTTLDLGQLKKVFTGSIRNWGELGGAAAEVAVFARAAGSGTASLFGERVLGNESYSASVHVLPTNEAIVAEIAARPGAIGYAGLGALRTAGDQIKIVPLRPDAHSAPVSPTPEAIRSGAYPLARTLYLAAAGQPSGTVKAFLDYCSSAQGLLLRAGYVGIQATGTEIAAKSEQ